MSDNKAAKLAAARKKLKDYQEKKNTKSVEFENDSSTDNPEHITSTDSNKNFLNELTPQTLNMKHIPIKPQTQEFYESLNTCNTQSPLHTNDDQNKYLHHGHMKATEILVAEKQNLESKVHTLELSLQQLKDTYLQSTSELNFVKNNSLKIETELRDAKENVKYLQNELESMRIIAEDRKLNENKLLAVKTELEEKLDEAFSELSIRKSENSSLLSQLTQLQRELEMTQLQMQLLTNGGVDTDSSSKQKLEDIDTKTLMEQNKVLQNKNTSLEQQINIVLNEKEQLVAQYQHYIQQMNQQMESAIAQNQSKEIENESLINREASLIDQISQMEIRIQALQNHILVLEKVEKVSNTVPDSTSEELKKITEQYEASKMHLQLIERENENARKELSKSEKKIIELTETIEMFQKDQPDLAKLTAANESDKVAAQRAIAQNTKLKEEFQGLQDAYLTMSNDKLELTEKLQAEKFLNRELTIKLSESEGLLKEVQNKLKAKDEEMIRLQSNCSQLEKQSLLDSQEMDRLRHYEVTQSTEGVLREQLKQSEEQISKLKLELNSLKNGAQSIGNEQNNHNTENTTDGIQCDTINKSTTEPVIINNNLSIIHTEEAMMKLQERFLKTMKQVAELSDEKQNLEHIVLQLQGETETICEYIALYQQQRGILKQREEDRIAQLKYIAAERDRMQRQLEELQRMITETQHDTSSTTDFKFRHEAVDKMVNLLSEIKQSHLVDPHTQCSNFENFHPCPWCSGKLINV